MKKAVIEAGKTERINVTKSILPQLKDYAAALEPVFDRHVLTNNGQQCADLAYRLEKFLGIKDITLCANGTLGLEMALHAAGCAGKKIITTPFTYVATTSAALWVGCEVIYADIDPETLSISPAEINKKMSSDISGIMPVNVYGHPCDYEGISAAAAGQPVIYDAAQAFGARLNGRQLLDFGTLAICSLHATKVYHSAEGGFVVSHSEKMRDKLKLLRAFGHINDDHYCLGINAKMSELHASMGLLILDHYEEQLRKRKIIDKLYRSELKGAFRYPEVPEGFESNYGYFPVIFDSEQILMRVMQALSEKNIYPRRYFYPALTTLPYIKGQSCPVAEDIARRVFCLPIYGELDLEKVSEISDIVNKHVQ